jgi:FemAB-related protein (PEP-CTERM system-associated)
VKVSELGDDVTEWQNYVAGSPAATFYHGVEWRDVIRSAFGHNPCYLIAREEGQVRGVLPLIEMKSALFGHFFVSMPFLNYGGILSDSADAERALARAAAEIARRRGASHVELRQKNESSEPTDGWSLRTHKAALVIPLAHDPKPHWDALSSRLRGKVRKAEKNDAQFSVGGAEDLDAFYFLYALNMRDLGTPVYSREFFRHVMAQTGQRARILLVRRNGQPAAAAIALAAGGRMELPWICQNYAESTYNVNEFLYWKAIEWAVAEGVKELDLGRSTVGAGTYNFKLQWNPEVRRLFWYYWTPPGLQPPQLNPDNPKYNLAVRWWKKLPLPVANRIGPLIVRNIP